MQKATAAKVDWDNEKKVWHVRVQIGEEVIKRPLPKTPQDATEDVLRSRAITAAQDEGYEVDPAQVTVAR
jgi:hypothetical protein